MTQQRQRILIVDDNSTSAGAVAAVLATWDLDTLSVPGTEAALQIMRDPERSEQPFAIVLIDSNMPGSDGFDLAETILHQPELPGSLVMMLPSPGDFEGAARCRQLGLSSYITKPFSSAELADAITRALHAPVPVMRESTLFGGFEPLSEDGKLDVLVVEDDPVNRELAAGFLRKRGHEVTLASDGEEGLALLEAMRFDLVLMDVQMHGLSGVETTASIRARETEGGERIPIIAVSAHAGREDRERCLAAGMDGYITKPLSGPQLFSVIESIVPSGHSSGAGGSTAAAEPGKLLVQTSELLARVDGNVDLACRITRLFIEEAPKMMAELEEAIDAADARAVFSVAHRLKGSVANFPANEPLATAARMEMAGRRGEIQDAARTFVTLQEDVHDLVVSLELALHQLRAERRSRDRSS